MHSIQIQYIILDIGGYKINKEARLFIKEKIYLKTEKTMNYQKSFFPSKH